MEEFVKELTAFFQPPWNYIATAVALLLLNLNRIVEIRERWQSSFAETRRLEREKLYLEVIKLRRELQMDPTSAQVSDVVPEIARDLPPIRMDSRRSVLTDVIEAPPPPVHPRPAPAGSVRRFVANYPRPGSVLMWIAQALLIPLIGFLGMGTIGIVIVGFTDEEVGIGPGLLLAVLYGALTWLSYRGFRAAGSIRRDAAAV
jgi:hypothetical protein